MKKEEDIKLNENMSAEEMENLEDRQTVDNEDAVNEVEPEEMGENKDSIEALKEENSKLKDQLLRTIAEFDNFRKRTNKEKAELILNGGKKTITDILPVLDDFERALEDKSDDPVAIKEGMQMIFNKFVKTLEGMGVKKIETNEADFNTDYHEAIAMVPGVGEDKKGKVIDCVQTGYTMNDQVIRHAKVAVGQ
ncbi:nucleotide exchange factor GrpE [Segatella maculosa]|uniref:nucleotide exchange factor GrpE n=1 Tax=Segatella maculosa TaxID=439703 RepID=UPI0023EFAF03|nr:nucleotide exchange factor GrpE [Segatella maculosa]